MTPRQQSCTLFPYTTLFRSVEFLKTQGKPAYNERILESPEERAELAEAEGEIDELYEEARRIVIEMGKASTSVLQRRLRSEEHTSELQSLRHLVCRLLLEKK